MQTSQLPSYVREKITDATLNLSPELSRMCLNAFAPIKRQKLHRNVAKVIVVATVVTDVSRTFQSIYQAKEVKLSDSPITVAEIASEPCTISTSLATSPSSVLRVKKFRLAIPNVFKPLPQKHEMQSPKPVVTTRGIKRRRSVANV
jgi:hypothetical protein